YIAQKYIADTNVRTPPPAPARTGPAIVRCECSGRSMVKLNLAPLHGDAPPSIASLARYNQWSAGRAVYVFDVVGREPRRSSTVDNRGPREFIERRVSDIKLAAVILDTLAAVEETSSFENDLFTGILESAAAIKIDLAVPYRDIYKMIVPRAAMNFITVPEAVDVVLAVNGPRRAARNCDGAARTSGADHLNMLESCDVAVIGAIDKRLERERGLPLAQTGKIKRSARIA